MVRRPGSSPIGSPTFALFIFVKECKMLASLDMPHGPHSADMFALEIVGDICIPCFVVGMLHSHSCLNYVP